MMKQTHLLQVNTREGILKLDGIDLMNCATSCTVRYHSKGMAYVTLTLDLIAGVELEDLYQAHAEKATEGTLEEIAAPAPLIQEWQMVDGKKLAQSIREAINHCQGR